MTTLYRKIILGAVGVIVLLGLTLYIIHLQGQVATRTIERDDARSELAASKRSLAALQRSAIERQADNTRIDAAEKVLSDDLDRIERALPKDAKPAEPHPAIIAVDCERMRRSGQSDSPKYRARC